MSESSWLRTLHDIGIRRVTAKSSGGIEIAFEDLTKKPEALYPDVFNQPHKIEEIIAKKVCS